MMKSLYENLIKGVRKVYYKLFVGYDISRMIFVPGLEKGEVGFPTEFCEGSF